MNGHVRLVVAASAAVAILTLLAASRGVAQHRQVRLPLAFVETGGRLGDDVAFVLSGRDKTMFFERRGFTIALRDPAGDGWVVKVEFVGGRAVHPGGEQACPARFSYFRGSRDRWRSGLRSFERIVYENVWPGIDVTYGVQDNALKYTFRVRPALIRASFDCVTGARSEFGSMMSGRCT